MNPHTVTITLSDGTVLTFSAVPDPQSQLLFPIDFTTMHFAPMPGVTGYALRTVGSHDDLIVNGGIGPVELLDIDTLEPWDPQRYLLQQFDGNVVIAEFTLDKDFNATVPEPATLLLVGTGLAGLALRRKRWV